MVILSPVMNDSRSKMSRFKRNQILERNMLAYKSVVIKWFFKQKFDTQILPRNIIYEYAHHLIIQY